MTLAHALRLAAAAGLTRLDAQMLLLLALGRATTDRAWLLGHDSDALDAASAQRWEALLQRRLQGEPMAYLTGEQEFFGLLLQVDPRVLVPRADTETLVQWALDLLPGLTAGNSRPQVLDLGTGSGAIALAIQSHYPLAEVSATDASPHALAVARGNAQRLDLPVRFQHGHWLEAVTPQRFHLIVSNPPYIAEGDPHLSALTHEPGSALNAGPDGLADLRLIVASAPAALHPGGWLLLEHGFDQAARVRELLADTGFERVSSRQDLAGIERCSAGLWPPQRQLLAAAAIIEPVPGQPDPSAKGPQP
jgi:release factor glutamine methyltransferase